MRYVEGQRAKCPWFYFLPLEDILQFVCYGKPLDDVVQDMWVHREKRWRGDRERERERESSL